MVFPSTELRESCENSPESWQEWMWDGVPVVTMTGLENSRVVVGKGREIIKFYPQISNFAD